MTMRQFRWLLSYWMIIVHSVHPYDEPNSSEFRYHCATPLNMAAEPGLEDQAVPIGHERIEIAIRIETIVVDEEADEEEDGDEKAGR